MGWTVEVEFLRGRVWKDSCGGAVAGAAAEALRELLARLAAGWAGKSNKWASEPKLERRVASVRAALRKV